VGTVATIEMKLEAQQHSDAAEAKRLEAEEAKCKAEEEEAKRKAEEREQREEEKRQEDMKLAEVAALNLAKMVEEQQDIIRIELELEVKRQAYSDAQKGTGINVDDAGDDDSSDSAPENKLVHYSFTYSLYSILITLYSSVRGPQSRTRLT